MKRDMIESSAPVSLAERTSTTLRWLGQRLARGGAGHATGRAWSIWRSGRSELLMDHLRHSESMALRDQRYARWLADQANREVACVPSSVNEGPTISILMPAWRSDERYLRRCLESILSQTYANWELCFVEDGCEEAGAGHPTAIAREFADRDRRVRIGQRRQQGGISAATNDALAMATGEFVALVDHDDELAPEALARFAQLLQSNATIDAAYCDEDKIDDRGRRHCPALKPGFSLHHLLTSNYICHLLIARTSLVKQVGGLRSAFDGAQDYDLVLRLARHARRFEHIPEVLYHWRSHEQSTSGSSGAKSFAAQAGCDALVDWASQAGVQARVEHSPFALSYRVRPIVDETDQVDLVACDSPNTSNLASMVSGVQRHSRWALFLDQGLAIKPADWITRLLELGLIPGTGAVGATIIDCDDRVAESGWLYDTEGIARARHRGAPVGSPGYLWSLRQSRNVSFVSGSCMLVRWEYVDALLAQDQSTVSVQQPWFVRLCDMLRRRGLHIAVHGDVRLRRTRPESEFPTWSAQGMYDGLWNPILSMIEPEYAPGGTGNPIPISEATPCAALSG